jgi:flagellar biosynthesis protein FlhG
MKPIEEQTYYEILEVTPNAAAKEIQQAYERVRETFNDDSVAIYSLFSEGEIRKIQAAIEEAYRVLLEEALRKGPAPSHIQMPDKQRWEKPPELGTGPKEAAEIPETRHTPIQPQAVKEIPGGIGDYHGRTLKQIRERMGIELEEVSAETRISLKTLQSIEEEAFETLPALVYLKGFLRSYAQSLGLDPARVVEGYLRFVNERSKK